MIFIRRDPSPSLLDDEIEILTLILEGKITISSSNDGDRLPMILYHSNNYVKFSKTAFVRGTYAKDQGVQVFFFFGDFLLNSPT